MWTNLFAAGAPHPARVREAALKLNERRDHQQVISLLEAAITAGQAQPWMYEVLALTMEVAGRPREEIERVLLSNVDFTAVNVPNTLYSAAMLTRFGRRERALELYRQAAVIDPTRAETYVLAVKLADEVGSASEVGWSAAGVLAYVWTRDWKERHREAEAVANKWEAKLRSTGDTKAADALKAQVADGRIRDLDCELTWNGTGDLELVIEEPNGSVCAFDRARTPGGGVHIHDGYGPDQKNTWERYVCPRAFAGDYLIRVRHSSGEIVGKRASLKVIRNGGSPNEKVDVFPIVLDSRERTVRITLAQGRLKEAAQVPEKPDAAGIQPAGWKRRLVAARQARIEPAIFAQQGGAAIGAGVANTILPAGAAYQPVITVLRDGVSLATTAVVSADRRYVRLSLAPTLSAVTDVFTFSFLSSGNNTGGGQQPNAQGGGQR